MPALNIRFSEDELAGLRQRAEAEGVPVTRLVHDAAMGDTARAVHFARVVTLSDEVARQDADILKRLADL